jgi:hypothetical protein
MQTIHNPDRYMTDLRQIFDNIGGFLWICLIPVYAVRSDHFYRSNFAYDVVGMTNGYAQSVSRR